MAYGGHHDVFLSYNSAEEALVGKLARRLAKAGVSYFLHSESIRPGELWVSSLEEALKTSNACAICLGPSGVGPWMTKELQSALSRAAHDSHFRLIPVLLPGSSHEQLKSTSPFLSQHHAYDLRRGFEGNNPKRFGRDSLSLPDSPGRCLAIVKSEQRAVLLLDQVDALRWTGAHSSEAWDVCRETILDALNALPTTKVVVCCRTFDLQHDPQLRNWKEKSRDLREMQIGDLSDEQVRNSVNRAASSKGEARPIEDRELKLLRHIHHLQMWLTIYPSLGPKGSLGTRRALMEAFWQDRRTELKKLGISTHCREAIETRLVDELEAILSLPVLQNLARNEEGPQVGENLCDFLQRYAEYPWTDSALDFLVWAAQHHPDPSPDYYPVGSFGNDSDHFNHLENNALNVTRGRAAYAVQSLLFEHPEFLPKLRPAIESLIDDPHLAVRVAALGACLPVIRIADAEDQAIAWFLEASEGPDQLLATRAARQFLRYTYRSHLNRLLPTLDRMVASPVQVVAGAGATCVAAAYLVTDEIEERFERCVTGTPEQRNGVAQVAASLIGEGEYSKKAMATLLRLAGDTDEEVAQEVARSFRHLDLRLLQANREAWSLFARSKAFQADPTPLLRALEEQSGNLLPFADCLLTVGETFAKELADTARDHARGFAGDAHYLLPLLLRLYEQAKEGDQVVYGRCLDLWDLLLERRVGSAMGLTREIDRL